jgi:hypothetical protein
MAMQAAPARAAGHRLPVVVSADPADWTPHALNGRVYAFAQVGSRIVVGGTFTHVQAAAGGPILTRTSLFAFDPSSGAIDSGFAPVVDGDVWALEPAADGHSVYVGGSFAHVNGDVVRKLVELDVNTGNRVGAFKSTADAVVRDVELDRGKLYVAGAFQSIGGAARTSLARLDAVTGAVDRNLAVPFGGARIGGTSIHHIDITPNGRRLIAIGDFTVVGGRRRSQAVMLDLGRSPVSVAPWSTDRFDDLHYDRCAVKLDSYVRDVQFSPDGFYFVIVTSGGPNGVSRTRTLCDSATRWETGGGPGSQPTWIDYTGGDTFWSVAVTGTAVYVGGHQRWVNNSLTAGHAGPGGVPRPGIAAFDPRNGLPLSWNPTRDRGVGAFVLYATEQGLWVGSDTEQIGHEYHARMALMPTAGGTAMPNDAPGKLPSPLLSAPIIGRKLAAHRVQGSKFTAQQPIPTSIPWGSVSSAMLLGSALFTAQDDGRLQMRTFDASNGASGVPANVPLHRLQSQGLDDDLAHMTGMFFSRSSGRWYYTVGGDPHLYYRYLTVESRMIGADRFVAATGSVWAHIAGMTLANGHLYYADGVGKLWRRGWKGAPAGAAVQVSGPGVDHVNWRSHGLFVAT